MPETLKITATESVTVKRSTEDLLELEAHYGPASKPPPMHWHPSQAEHFRILEGEMTVRVAGAERTLHAGDEIDVPIAAPHQMWNSGSTQARVTWQTMPRGRTEQWFRAIDSLHREGRVGSSGIPSPLAFGVLLSEYDDVFRLDLKPQFLAGGALRLLGGLGRLRGYSATPKVD